ncbi:MAG: DUF58 domain-containing protein [Alphaproteobacteria bacterium]|nr:DUF58 domain-containing protein [Alphaproteobacteria bacterium]
MERLRTLLRRARDLFPLTWGGMVLLGAAGWGFSVGVARQDLMLLILGGLGLLLGVAATLSALTAAAWVAWRLHRRPAGAAVVFECGAVGRTDFVAGAPWLVPFVALTWGWERPLAQVRLTPGRGGLAEAVTPARRGEHEAVVRRVEVEDCFGLVRVAFPSTERRPVRINPAVGALRNIHVVRGLSGGDLLTHPEGDPAGDRVDMRRYADGDPIRFVLWKVFARSRKLVVRAPELALTPARQAIAYLVAGPGDGPAAGAARLVVEEGALGEDWCLGADGCVEQASDRHAAMGVILRSADAGQGDQGAGLAAFLKSQGQGRLHRVVVFVPPRPGPWLDRVVQAVQERPGLRPEFVIGADGLRRPEGRWARAWRRPEPEDRSAAQADRAELAEVMRRLGATGGEVSLADRRTGQVFPASTLDLRKVG